ncbi:MAG: hypothetical protein DRJ31_05870 [Candidatus Methanomethylicota archaeon]|uniref:Uncharacterized protein n=1 Tax=Thermoproteota archaeon TaxID=2056631 RepID=A0A497F429_9CREN|nr:MAG: hypothetical protein DRJ31_05870 [Candidatus Verstraetearchaeota archaeon]RLE53708.1 MAG: hypothetical protein DRJ33_00285 [Candidatus Verstraetearchaeota archaeon]
MAVRRFSSGRSKPIKCPVCGYEFSLVYSRAVACAGCQMSVYGCNLVKCPRCGHEFSEADAYSS